MSPQASSDGSGKPPGTSAGRKRTPPKGARPASSVNSSTRNQVTESVNTSESAGKSRPPGDPSDDRVVVVSTSDDDAVNPPGGAEDGDATLHIRGSSIPDASWSPGSEGPGGGPTRPAQKPPAGGLPASGPGGGSMPGSGPPPGAAPAMPAGPGTAPRPGPNSQPRPGPGPQHGPDGSPRPGSGPQRPGTAPRPGAAPPGPGGRGGQGGSRAGAKQPASGTGSKQGGFGAVSALSTPEPVTGRGEQRDKTSSAKAPRKAHLVLRRVEPWSAMKFSFVVSLVCFVVLFVAVAVLYGVLSALGVFDSIVNTVTQLTVPDGKTTSGLDIKSWFEPVRILGYTALLGAVNVVLITALSTLGAVIYNVASDLVGGVEVTFSEAE